MRDAIETPSPAVEHSEAARWGACFVAVVALHCAFAIAVFANWESTPPPGAPPAVMVELAALPVAPSSQPSEIPPGPEATASEAEPEPEEKPQEEVTPPVEKAAEVEPEVEPAPQPVTEAEAEPELEPTPTETAELKLDIEPPPVPEPVQIPDLLPAPKPEVAIVVPPSPKEEKVEPKKEIKKKPPPKKTKPRPRSSPSTTAPQSAQQTSPRAASIASVGSNSSLPDWRSRIVSHLQRNKRFPAGVQAGGTASVRFTIDRNGRVLSSGLAGSSGNSTLDAEATAMISRSNPFPSAPADVTGGPFSFSVPVRFSQR